MNRIITSLCFTIFAVAVLTAQPIRDTNINQKFEAAKLAEEQGNYAGAFDWYEKAYDEMRETSGRRSNPELKRLALKLAELDYRLRDYEDAEKKYERVLKKDEDNEFAEYRYMYALSLKANAKYTQALEEFNKVISLSEDEETIKMAEFHIEGIESLRTLEPNVETSIRMLDKSINSPSAEYSPRENLDGDLYYGSLNRKTVIEVDDKDDDEYHAKIYVASRNDEGVYEDGEELDQNVNRIGFHNTHLAFSRDGRVMYFTRVQTKGTDISSSLIMVSYRTDSGWSAATPASGINGDWVNKHPAVGQLFGNDVLFFVSDMAGGEGGLDIYYANINSDGSFSAPVNLGKRINTPGDEITPFYYQGTLYFSTESRPTIGGYDIFYSVWDGSEWSEPTNMGLGYNSSADDHYFYIAEGGNRGYFISNRPSKEKKKLRSETCCDDIFAFQIRDIVIDLLAIVVDETDAPVPEATIKLENISDPVNFPPDMKFNSLGNEFQFLLDSDFKYMASITCPGYYPDTISFTTAGIFDNYTVKKKVTLKTKEKRIVTVNEPIRLDNIYYDFDDYKILPDAEDDLEFLFDLMDEYPDMVIELSSHTDSQGPARYNLELSQKRAESARNWLIKRGVDKDRIKPVGYGEKQILNKCENRVPCTDEEHRFNRRTEFKIIAGPQSIEITREIK